MSVRPHHGDRQDQVGREVGCSPGLAIATCARTMRSLARLFGAHRNICKSVLYGTPGDGDEFWPLCLPNELRVSVLPEV
jgi:hypothetical protein